MSADWTVHKAVQTNAAIARLKAEQKYANRRDRERLALARAWEEGLRAGKLLAADAIGPNPVEHPVNPYLEEPQ